MLFCFNPKANPRIEKTQQFIFFKRCFYKFFSTLLVFHSYLELFINHNQWMLLEDRFPNLKIAEPKQRPTGRRQKIWHTKFTVEISIHGCKKPGRRNRSFQMVECSHFRMVFSIFVPIPSKQQTKHVTTLSVCKNVRILIFGATGSAANVFRAPGPTIIRALSNETMGLRVPRKKF